MKSSFSPVSRFGFGCRCARMVLNRFLLNCSLVGLLAAVPLVQADVSNGFTGQFGNGLVADEAGEGAAFATEESLVYPVSNWVFKASIAAPDATSQPDQASVTFTPDNNIAELKAYSDSGLVSTEFTVNITQAGQLNFVASYDLTVLDNGTASIGFRKNGITIYQFTAPSPGRDGVSMPVGANYNANISASLTSISLQSGDTFSFFSTAMGADNPFEGAQPSFGSITFSDFSFSPAAIPEPSTYASLVGGLILAMVILRRRAG